MTEGTKHVYLIKFWGSNTNKYFLSYDEEQSIPPDLYGEYYSGGKRILNANKIKFIFKLEDVKTEKEEKRLRNYDVLRGGGYGTTTIISERILDCFSHLIDKDIQILPSEIYTANGKLEGYYLIDVICLVSGVDKVNSTYYINEPDYPNTLDKLVPRDENFMEGHELAREADYHPHIYIVPSLREKLLKIKKGKDPQGTWICTAKEDWEGGRNIVDHPELRY